MVAGCYEMPPRCSIRSNLTCCLVVRSRLFLLNFAHHAFAATRISKEHAAIYRCQQSAGPHCVTAELAKRSHVRLRESSALGVEIERPAAALMPGGRGEDAVDATSGRGWLTSRSVNLWVLAAKLLGDGGVKLVGWRPDAGCWSALSARCVCARRSIG
eukprot:363159-Chlamydomonas_euryale.AAC.8